MKRPIESPESVEGAGLLVSYHHTVEGLQQSIVAAPRDLNIYRSSLRRTLAHNAWRLRLDTRRGAIYEFNDFKDFVAADLPDGLHTDFEIGIPGVVDVDDFATRAGMAGHRQSLTGWGDARIIARDGAKNQVSWWGLCCTVLPDKTRLVTKGDINKALGRTGRPNRNSCSELPPFLAADNLKDFVSKELIAALNPIIFWLPKRLGVNGGGRKLAHGYPHTVLLDVCRVYRRAHCDGWPRSIRSTLFPDCD